MTLWLVRWFGADYRQAVAYTLVLVGMFWNGSGAIALALATERPQWRITASDRSTAALEVARGNGQRLGLCNVVFCSGDWFEAVTSGLQYTLRSR